LALAVLVWLTRLLVTAAIQVGSALTTGSVVAVEVSVRSMEPLVALAEVVAVLRLRVALELLSKEIQAEREAR
jgi:hypothetical protein